MCMANEILNCKRCVVECTYYLLKEGFHERPITKILEVFVLRIFVHNGNLSLFSLPFFSFQL